MRTRNKGYRHYQLSKEDVAIVLEYCRSPDADKQLILECANKSNDTIAKELCESVEHSLSYERFGYIPIRKEDFYGYRRKMIYLISNKLSSQ